MGREENDRIRQSLYKMLSTFINNAFEFLITWVGTFRVGIRLVKRGRAKAADDDSAVFVNSLFARS